MTLRDVIMEQIECYTEERNIVLSDIQIQMAANGVEFYISEAMAESIEVAIADVMGD